MKKEHCHFIGIGGIGMSGLANLALQQGYRVSGSDLSFNYLTASLARKGALIYKGHDATHIPSEGYVIYNSDIAFENPEYQLALEKGLILHHRSQFLWHLAKQKVSIAVTGTHGKTTTTALLAHLLIESGVDPSYAVGGIVRQQQSNSYTGSGNYFIFEADESDNSFIEYSPSGAIITNIDNDHLVKFGSMENLEKAFSHFAQQVQNREHLIWCGDDSRLRNCLSQGVTYGFQENNTWHITNHQIEGLSQFFRVSYQNRECFDLQLPLLGKHNLSNALGCFAMGMALGIPASLLQKAMETFQGVQRRTEFLGCLKLETGMVEIIDDYAHHPKEVSTTLQGLRKALQPSRLVVLFQPHSFTRTVECAIDFGTAFDAADALFLTEIYAACENPIKGVSHHLILEAVREKGSVPVQFLSRHKIEERLLAYLQPSDLLVVMGAGDITEVGRSLIKHG